jgi:hypothetical protein
VSRATLVFFELLLDFKVHWDLRNWFGRNASAIARSCCQKLCHVVGLASVITAQSAASQPARQPTLRIDGNPSCGSCGIQVSRVTRLGVDDGSGSIAREPKLVARDSRGNFYVLSDVLPQVFSPTGQFLRTVGGVGDGPGEVRALTALAIGRSDSVLTIDASGSRLTLFSATGVFARTGTVRPTGRFFTASALPDGSLATTGQVGGVPPTTPIHIISPSMRVVHSFGDTGDQSETAAMRTLAVAVDGTIIAAYRLRHAFDRFDSTGALLGKYEIDAGWFATGAADWSPNPSEPPPINTRRIAVDSTGLLWLFTYVPRPDWAKAVRPLGGGRPGYRYDAFSAFYTRVEVVDLLANKVLVSQVIPLFIGHALSGGLVSSYAETDDGIPVVTISRLTLRR